jgi:DnaK suppressor protein
MSQDLENYKKLLEAEKVKLVKELETVGRVNPENPKDWEAIETNLDADSADENEVADELEEFEGNSAILKQLETQLISVESALQKIEDGTYGQCSVCEEKIPEDRLKANPSATTCVEHSK